MGYPVSKVVLLSAASAVAVIPLLSQTPETKKPAFEVTSVKPSPPAGFGFSTRGGGPRGNRFAMTGATLRMLLQFAYRGPTVQPGVPGPGLMNNQIVGAPSWIDSDRFDIQATAGTDSSTIPPDRMQLMVQSLLEDRFQLKAHLETRELPIYNLVVGKDGPKLKLSEDQTPVGPPALPPPALPPPPSGGVGQRGFAFDSNGPQPRGGFFVMASPSGITISGSAVPIANLINVLAGQVGRPVVDKTGLKGLFDFKLSFNPEGLNSPFGGAPIGATAIFGGVAGGPGPGGAQITPPSEPAPSLFTAIQELGLRLESTRGPAQVLVIESVQKPEEN
jgi:uncharacterized protein (TIGR03435 family)